MNYQESLKELYSRPEWKFRLGLVNMKVLLKKLGNPEQKLKCIHVAGTNGKGSVCAILNSILKEAGYLVGMYTSPHLKKFNERVRVNDKLILDGDVAKYYLKVKKHVTNQSFFEITTAMMFLYFADKKVDTAVIETGMGGRLDSTNLIKPMVSVITNIGLEHQKQLGNTLSKVASEKAGIIKEGIPTVTGAEGTALKTIKTVAKRKKSTLYRVNERFIFRKNGKFDFGNYKNLSLNLNGYFIRHENA